MVKVLLDTNFLIYCAKQKIDYEEEIKQLVKSKADLYTVSLVVRELRILKEKAKKYSDKESAELALKLLKHNKVKTLRIKAKSADDAIVKSSKNNIVATHDLALAKRVKKAIVIRGKRKLAFR